MTNKTKTKLAIEHGFSFAGEAFSLAVCLKNKGKTEEALAALKVALEAEDAQDLADTFNTVNEQAIERAGITQEEFQDDVDEDSEEVKAALVAVASMLETASDDEDENFDDDEEDEDESEEDDEDEDEDEDEDMEEESEFDEPDGEEDEFGEGIEDRMTASEERSRKRRKERTGRVQHNATLARAVLNKSTLGKKRRNG